MPIPANEMISINTDAELKFQRPDPAVSNLKNILSGPNKLKLPNSKKVLRNFLNSGLKTFKSAS